MFLTARSSYVEREKPSLFIHINRRRICSKYPHVPIVHTIQISTPVRLYEYKDLRQHNTYNTEIKESLLLQYLSLIQNSKVAESWIGIPQILDNCTGVEAAVGSVCHT